MSLTARDGVGPVGVVEADDLRRCVGMPGRGAPLGVDEAVEAGHRLVWDPALDAHRPSGRGEDAVAEVATQAAGLLARWGVHLTVLRRRPGCVVARVTYDRQAAALAGCALARGLLEAIPTKLGYADGAALETGFVDGADAGCLLTVLWRLHGPRTEPVDLPPTGTPGGDGDGGELGAAGGTAGAAPDADDSGDRARSAVVHPVAVLERGEPGSAVLPAAPDRLSVEHLAAQGPSTVVHPRRTRGAWLQRRAWILIVMLVVGAAVAHLMATRHQVTYTAQATLVVQSGADSQGPGAANDAAALAITYASFIPTDAKTLGTAARQLGVSSSTLRDRVGMTAETGTAVLALTYSAPTPAQAVHGADVLARIVALPQSGSGIPRGSIAVVHLPTSAAIAGSLQKYAVPIGALLGLAVGLVVVLAVERADPRLDDEDAVSEALGCPCSALPGEAGAAELARAIALRADGRPTVTVVPLVDQDAAVAKRLAEELWRWWPSDLVGPAVTAAPSLAAAAADRSHGGGATVLIVRKGAPRRLAAAAAQRLRLVDRALVWVVLPEGRRRRRPVVDAR